jgi:hypothetical protein
MSIRSSLFVVLALLVGSCLPSCSPVAAQPQAPLGAPQGWDDLKTRAMDFEVQPIEPGVALLVDTRTGRGWILAGSPQSWQAIEPVGGL